MKKISEKRSNSSQLGGNCEKQNLLAYLNQFVSIIGVNNITPALSLSRRGRRKA